MDLIALLSVLAVTHAAVSARPADMVSKTKRSTDDSSKAGINLFKPSLIKFPTEIRQGFTVTINGTIDPENKIFEVAFPDNDKDKNEDCKVIYDLEKEQIEITPVSPGQKGILPYVIGSWGGPEVYPTFSIKLLAGIAVENHMFKLSFEGNGADRSTPINCPIASFDDYAYVEFRRGVHNITSLLFEY